MRTFVVVGINRLSAMNLLFSAGLEDGVDYTIVKEDLKNTYEINVNDKSSKIIGKMMMLSN